MKQFKSLVAILLINFIFIVSLNAQTKSEILQHHLQSKFGNEWQVFVEEFNFKVCKVGLKARLTLLKNTPGSEVKVLIDSANEFGLSKKDLLIEEREICFINGETSFRAVAKRCEIKNIPRDMVHRACPWISSK